MISKSQIDELRNKWQTTEFNVAREYVQHVLLSVLYGEISSNINLAFKGGTALRILRQSPRFSEDLDFTGWGKAFHVQTWIERTVHEADKAGLNFRILDSNPTSGGWFALMETDVHQWPVQIEWNVSLRKQKNLETETVLATSPLWIPYSVKALPVDQMIEEKIQALLRRKEPRDFFDIYFAIRQRLAIKRIAAHKERLLEQTNELNPRTVARQLQDLLPRSQWVLAKQLPKLLIQELERF